MDKVIKEIRLKLGLTQEEFAKKVGVSVVTISKYENGVTQPTAQKMALIEGLLNNPNNAIVTTQNKNCRNHHGSAINYSIRLTKL